MDIGVEKETLRGKKGKPIPQKDDGEQIEQYPKIKRLLPKIALVA